MVRRALAALAAPSSIASYILIAMALLLNLITADRPFADGYQRLLDALVQAGRFLLKACLAAQALQASQYSHATRSFNGKVLPGSPAPFSSPL